MRRLFAGMIALGLAGATFAGTAASQPKTSVATTKVMVLGVYHLSNPGLDLRNIEADDPTSPRRQKELAALADALAQFRPTRVMLEYQTKGPDFDVPAYHQFTPEKLASDRDETVQIGFRLAQKAGLKSVQGIDEQGGEGEPDYFPFDKVEGWAKANGRKGDLDAAFVELDADLKVFNEAQKRETIPALLLRRNTPEAVDHDHRFYTRLMGFGDDVSQPGADLNAYWFMRNAKIFAKLMLASRPGDRVVVIFGSGHGYWLRQLAATTPGYELVDVAPYLKEADRRARRGR